MGKSRAEGGEQHRLTRSTLGWLLAQLGPRVVRVESAPRGLDVPVGDPVIYDAVVPPAAETGDLVLAIGMSASSGDALELVRWAGTRGASAAAFKIGGDPPLDLAAAAEAAGVALLVLPPETAWDQFYALVRRIMATAAELPTSEDEPPMGDVFALANAIAAMVGGAVVINDLQLQVIAYSTLDDPIDETRRQSILGRRPPEEIMRKLREAGVFRQMLHSQEAVRLPDWTGTRPRLGITIRAGKEPLGFMFVTEGRAPLGEGAAATLLEAARIAALHLLRLRSSRDLERRQRSDLLRGVLSGRGSINLLASRLGLKPTGAFTVVGFEFADSADPGDDPEEDDEDEDVRLRRSRVRDLILLQSEALRSRAATVSASSVIYTLLPGSEPLPANRLLHLANEVIDHAERAHQVRLRAGIGSTVSRLDQVEQSRFDADQVLRLLKRGVAGRRTASIDQLRAHAFLLELAEVESLRPHLQHGKVAALARHDADSGTAYVETLRAFLDALGDMTLASKQVHVHRNTFRYRMQRLCELVSLDLDDPVERLVAELQLRLLEH